MRKINLSAGETLFRKGEEAGEAYMVLAGTIKISSDVLSVDLGKEELFGESGLVGNIRQADAIAKTDCRLFALTADEFRDSIKTSPDTALRLVEVLIHRLAYVISDLEDAKRLVS